MEHYAVPSDDVTTLIITLIIISIMRADAVTNGEATVEDYVTMMRHTLAWTDGGGVVSQHRIAGTEAKSAEHDGQMKREIGEEERLRYFSDMVISTQANSTNEMTMNP